MKLTLHGPNQTEIELKDRFVFFSYNTPVAVFVIGVGAYRTKTAHSKTTQKHIAQQGARWGISRWNEVEQETLEHIAEGKE